MRIEENTVDGRFSMVQIKMKMRKEEKTVDGRWF